MLLHQRSSEHDWIKLKAAAAMLLRLLD